MTEKERLVELLKEADGKSIDHGPVEDVETDGYNLYADYLLEGGVIVPPETGIGDVSDGYHTFNELYHHRAVLFSVICNTFKDKAWKSKKHDTGDMFDGMFIVGIETPQGQATYHYDIDPYWDMFKVKELPNAPKWDGHTPEEAIRRISMLQTDSVIVPPCKVGDTVYYAGIDTPIKFTVIGFSKGRMYDCSVADYEEIVEDNELNVDEWYVHLDSFCGLKQMSPLSSFGKRLFVGDDAEKEAEKVLKERESNG